MRHRAHGHLLRLTTPRGEHRTRVLPHRLLGGPRARWTRPAQCRRGAHRHGHQVWDGEGPLHPSSWHTPILSPMCKGSGPILLFSNSLKHSNLSNSIQVFAVCWGGGVGGTQAGRPPLWSVTAHVPAPTPRITRTGRRGVSRCSVCNGLFAALWAEGTPLTVRTHLAVRRPTTSWEMPRQKGKP